VGGYGAHLGATRQWCSVTSDGDDAKGGGRTGVAILGRRVRDGWDANDKDVKIGQYMVFALARCDDVTDTKRRPGDMV
jgi:hypothetical protein